MAEPSKIQITIPTKFELGPDSYLFWDEAPGISFEGVTVLKDGEVVGVITHTEIKNKCMIGTVEIEDQASWEKFMKSLRKDPRSLSCGVKDA